MTRAYRAEDFGVEDYRDPDPEPEFIDDSDCAHCAPYLPLWCETCQATTTHGEWWINEDYPARVGMACLTCRRIAQEGGDRV